MATILSLRPNTVTSTSYTQSRKTYAEVVKEFMGRQSASHHLDDISSFRMSISDDEWTDVSSVTSCDWPEPIATDLILDADSSGHGSKEPPHGPHMRENIFEDLSVYAETEFLDNRAKTSLDRTIKHTIRRKGVSIGSLVLLKDETRGCGLKKKRGMQYLRPSPYHNCTNRDRSSQNIKKQHARRNKSLQREAREAESMVRAW